MLHASCLTHPEKTRHACLHHMHNHATCAKYELEGPGLWEAFRSICCQSTGFLICMRCDDCRLLPC